MNFKYRDYQEKANSDIEYFIHESKHKKGVLVSPVATGKSIYPSVISENTKGNCLIIQPNKELLEQNVAKARSFGLDPSIYSASAGSKVISKLTYATPMSIAKKPEDFKHFDIVGIDECFSGSTRISCNYSYNKTLRTLWEDKYIKKIDLPKIKSYNIKKDIVEEDEILNIVKTEVKEVYNIYLDTRKIIKCTLNHPFLTNNGWKKVEDITKNDFIITSYSIDSEITNPYLLPTPIQEQIIIGSELGDGNLHQLSSNKIRLRIIHGEEQGKYLEWKNNLLWKNKIEKIKENGYSKKIANRFTTKMFYKFFNSYEDLLSKMDILSFAILYMDDGSFNKKNKSSTIYSMCDEEEKVIKLNNRINQLLNIKGILCSYIKKDSGTKINYIRYNVEDTKTISKSIRQYVPEVMQYKLREEDRGLYKEIKSKINSRKVCQIEKIEFYKKEECFDIQVKKNKNFIVCTFKTDNGEIVHNCHLGMTNKYSNGRISEKGKFNKFLDQINPSKIIGLTATPIQLVPQGFGGSELKMINRSMRSYWYKSDIFHITQIQDIKDDYWADLDIRTYDFDSSMLELNSNGSEFKEASVIKQYEDNGIEYEILKKYYDLLDQGFDNILTFVPSVEQAIKLAAKNKDFEVVYDKTPANEREAIVRDFKNGSIPHLLNVNIFTTGFDHPGLKGIIMGRETNSFSMYYQMCGRVCRPLMVNGEVVGKKGIIEDLTGNTKRFGTIEDITFEKNDYTNGWGMWNDDRLLTGYPFGSWDMPLRQTLSDSYHNKGIIKTDEKIEDITLKFGKYKGKKLIESFEKEPRYFIWISENFDFNKPFNKPLRNPLNKLIEKYIAHGK